MAPPKTKGFSFKFDLSLGGLLGVGVVCFCIFLWMFLLGVWAGQTGLIGGMNLPGSTVTPAVPLGAKVEPVKRAAVQEPVMAPVPVSSPAAVVAAVETETSPVPVPEVKTPAVAAPAPVPASAPAPPVVVSKPSAPEKAAAEPVVAKSKGAEHAFYALQVGAFRASKNVEEELHLWRSRGQEPFARSPRENEHLTKVYLGHFPEAAGARKEADFLAKKWHIAPIVVTIKPE